MAAQSPLVNETPLHSPVPQSEAEEAQSSAANSGSEDESSTDEEPVEALATTRERRSNAGNRMAQLLKVAGAEDAIVVDANDEEDEVNLLFQEAEDDVEFDEREEGDDDANMSSNSESEDENAGDEDEGEKKLTEEQRRGPEKMKRKSEGLLQKTMRLKRLKYAPQLPDKATESATEAPRPKKKSERVSWIPEDAEIRSSSRKLAVINKQATHLRLKESERKREKTLQMMQAAEERKKAKEAQVLTQEERLARAAVIEKQNSKTVTRWEEAEKMRLDEQKAREDALKNRRLDGPVITYWSGPAVWINDKLKKVGRNPLVEELEAERDGKTKKRTPVIVEVPDVLRADGQPQAEAGASPSIVEGPTTEDGSNLEPPKEGTQSPTEAAPKQDPPATTPPGHPMMIDADPSAPEQAPKENDQPTFLDGIDHWVSLSKDNDQSTQATSLQQILPKPTSLPGESSGHDQEHQLGPLSSTLGTPTPMQTQPTLPQPPSPVRTKTLAMRSLVTLSSFDKLHRRGHRTDSPPAVDTPTTNHYRRHADRDSTVLLRTLFSVPPAFTVERVATPLPNSSAQLRFAPYDPSIPSSGGPRHSTRYLTKRATQCPITGLTAKYRDPKTGLPYANAGAFKMARAVVGDGLGRGDKGVWSGLLQAWVGESKPAKGVPDGVWEGTVAKKIVTDETESGKAAAVEANGSTSESAKK